MSFGLKIGGALAIVAGVFVASHFTLPPVISQQRGYRGHGDEILYLPKTLAQTRADNVSPPPEPAQDPAGQPASQVYQNLKVLGKIDANEFLRLMASIASWVAPVQGCTYCHNQDNLAYDSIYTKIVARRMLQMTEHINKDWKAHVGATGVTCYTCHRGQPVPTYVWFNAPPPAPATVGGFAETNQGKNLVSKVAVGSALPYDPLTTFLEQSNEIRVQPTQALPGTDNVSIKGADWTYALMMQMSNALGVNCNYCHATRAFRDWDQSPPQRVTAWYGIRMVRDLNNNYLDPLGKIFPPNRLGPLGDAPKVQCAVCHKGVYKPLFGVSLVKDYPEIGADGIVDLTANIGSLNDYKDKP
jgi:photosynthetic reaction center cytochrome c subunit